MGIWLFFLTYVYIIIACHRNAKSQKSKNKLLVLLIISLTYFSAFRDGLGMDYSGYQYMCEHEWIYTKVWWLIEPLANALQNFCLYTDFSAVIFFLVTSAIVCAFSIWVYSKFPNFYLAAFIFITYTNLYLATFNIVRQSVAAAIILLGTYLFIIKNKSPWFFCFVLLGFFFHKSAIVFVLLYFLKKDDYSISGLIAILVITYFVNLKPLFGLPIISDFLNLTEYSEYLTYSKDAYDKLSMSNFYLHFLIIFIISQKKYIIQFEDKESLIYALKMSVLALASANMSANSLPIAYRFAMFFSFFLPISLSYLPRLIKPWLARIVIYVPLLILLLNLLFSRIDDRIYCPERILPLNSIFDENYRPYENPDFDINLL